MLNFPMAAFKCGKPTGSAMPLCWSHAEYVSLVRSRRDRVVFDRIEPAYQRYVAAPVLSRYEIWSFRHQTRQIARHENASTAHRGTRGRALDP